MCEKLSRAKTLEPGKDTAGLVSINTSQKIRFAKIDRIAGFTALGSDSLAMNQGPPKTSPKTAAPDVACTP